MTPLRILIVEDEAITALDIEGILEDLGYTVVGSVDNGKDALNTVESENPNLILMDIKIKGEMDGIETAGLIWKEHKIPVIFLTSYSDEGTLSRAKLVQPFGYVLKPFEREDIHAAVELAQHRFEQEREERIEKPRLTQTSAVHQVQFGEGSLTTESFMRRVEPFRQLEEAVLTELVSLSDLHSFDAGTQIISEGEEDAPCFIVASGRIACIKGSASGKELVINLLPRGDTYAVIAALDENPFPFTARAERDSVLLYLPKDRLRTILEDHPEFYREFNDTMTEHIRNAFNLSRQLAHEKVEVRIAGALLNLLSEFGKFERKKKEYIIDITRQELADLVGTTPETAIRVTKAMERQGTLSLLRPSEIIVLSTGALEEMAND